LTGFCRFLPVFAGFCRLQQIKTGCFANRRDGAEGCGGDGAETSVTT
jgi:hypothetical protein